MRSLMVVHLLAACLGTDPLPAPDRPAVPRIVASPTSVQPVIPAGTPVALDVGKFVFLDLTNYTGPVTWEFSVPGVVEFYPEPPPGAAKDYYPGTKQGELVGTWHKPPSPAAVPCYGIKTGSVTVAAWGVVGTPARAKKIAELTIQVGPRGPPDPKPDPDPDPKPQPTAKDVYIVVVRSALNVTPAQANLIGDVAFWNTFKTGKTDWAIHNPGDEAAVKNGYANEAMKKQPGGNFAPVLLVLDMKDGAVLYCELLPPTKDAIKTEVNKVRK